jgi:hypothetical protein
VLGTPDPDSDFVMQGTRRDAFVCRFGKAATLLLPGLDGACSKVAMGRRWCSYVGGELP